MRMRRGMIGAMAAVMTLSLAAGAVFGLPTKTQTASAYDTVKPVTVSEIFEGDRFNSENLKALYGQIWNGTTDLDTIARGVNYNGTSVTDKNVIVEFGGMKWLAVYLSKADDSHKNEIDTAPTGAGKGVAEKDDVVLTLWLAEVPTDDAHKSVWNLDGDTTTSVNYPTNMYGTSYMRSQVLNNGGDYWKSATELQSGGQSADNFFAKFTMPSVADNVTDYLVAPRYIDWQYSQSSKISANYTYDLSNDAWGAETASNFYTSASGNYSTY